MKNCLLLIFCLLIAEKNIAQMGQIIGKITSKNGEPLVGVAVTLSHKIEAQELILKNTFTDEKGTFAFQHLMSDTYLLKASYVGYDKLEKSINFSQNKVDLGTLKMNQQINLLKEVLVKAKVEAVTQKGDTLQYKADAYKTHPDATAEDLVAKMPGIVVQNGTVTVHGENIKEVLLDGKPYFGDDPMTAMKNLPAEIIDKIEVFDRLSDQSQFTGFDDGNTTKTLNIITRSNKQEGNFGKIYAGYGTDDRYSVGEGMNFFDKTRRISIIGISNNINQQNFSNQDLLGVLSANGGAGQGGGGGGNRGGGGQGGGGGNPASNFMVGQQNGISTTNAFGLNYSDNWGKKITIRGSYFLNDATNINGKDLSRSTFLSENANQNYNESSNSNNHNFNNRFNLRFEYTIDKKNSILITPKFNDQINQTTSNILGANSLNDSSLVNKTMNNTVAKKHGFTFNNDVLFRHRFEKKGRTISFDLGTNFNGKSGNNNLTSVNQYFGVNALIDSVNQRTSTSSNGYQYSGNLVYTEPIGKGLFLMNYAIGISENNSVKETDNLNILTKKYDQQDTLLSNKFDNNYLTQKVGIGYNLRNKKIQFNIGVAYQRADLAGKQLYPHSASVNTSFDNVLPMMMMTYNFSQQSKLRLMYRTSTNAPSISQLQNVVDNSNPLFLTTGNPALRQEYNHSLVARYTLTKPKKANSMLFLLSANYTQNPISNAITIAAKDVILSSGIVLKKGAQITQPVNLSENWQTRSLLTFGTPISFIKSNLNFSSGFTYSQQPGMINNNINRSNQYNFSQSVVLSSNISTKVDFTTSYSINYTKVDNSIQPTLNNKYYVQNTSGKLTWLFGKGFVFQTDATYSQYNGLTSSFNQHFILLNMSFGKKFLKNNAGELKLTAFDLLKQNSSISQIITETSIETDRTKVLQQYFLMTFTYTLRNFKS